MKALVHYVFLVGLPVLGVLGVLHIGQNAEAPASVGGNWYVTWDVPLAGGCPALPDAADSASLFISQSGPHLVMELNGGVKTNLSGVLDELHITGMAAGWETAVFQAAVDRQPEPDQMSGLFAPPGCATSYAFTAVRQPAPEFVTRGH
jgi:hypothetical protein